jgi:hypothetical protein
VKRIALKLSLPLLLMTAVIVSCDKDDDDPTQRESLLTAREWKITDITRKKITDPATDSSILKACTTDDRLVFTFGGHGYQLRDNTTKCDTSIFAYGNGNWNFSNNETDLQLSGGARAQKWKVLTLNDSILKVEWRDSISTTNNVLKVISLKNK